MSATMHKIENSVKNAVHPHHGTTMPATTGTTGATTGQTISGGKVGSKGKDIYPL